MDILTYKISLIWVLEIKNRTLYMVNVLALKLYNLTPPHTFYFKNKKKILCEWFCLHVWTWYLLRLGRGHWIDHLKQVLQRFLHGCWEKKKKSNLKSTEVASIPNSWAMSPFPFTFFWDRVLLTLLSRLSSNYVIQNHSLSCFGYMSVPPLDFTYFMLYNFFDFFE